MALFVLQGTFSDKISESKWIDEINENALENVSRISPPILNVWSVE